MIKKAGSRSWTKPADLEGFQRCITEQLQDYTQENSIDGLNENITNALLESQNRYCPKTQREEKLSKFTKRLMDKRRAMRSEQLTTVDELRDINKQISKAIRRDLRTFNQNEIRRTIENNKSMKVLRKSLQSGTAGITKIRDHQGYITTNREEILKIVEDFYRLLYRSRGKGTQDSEVEPEILTWTKGIVNQGSETLPDITLEEMELALRNTKNNKSPGEDCVVADAIKIGGECLLQKIVDLFNLCLFDGTLPGKWYNAVVILLHKKGGT